jgi:hypothetical protein
MYQRIKIQILKYNSNYQFLVVRRRIEKNTNVVQHSFQFWLNQRRFVLKSWEVLRRLFMVSRTCIQNVTLSWNVVWFCFKTLNVMMVNWETVFRVFCKLNKTIFVEKCSFSFVVEIVLDVLNTESFRCKITKVF